jgi:hypothetical protein
MLLSGLSKKTRGKLRWEFVLMLLLSPALAIAQSPLVLYLPMEDAISPVDASVDPTDVTVLGALSLAEGQFGTNGLEFNGDPANRLEVTSAPKLEGMSALTIEGWVLTRNIANYEGMSVASKRIAYEDGDNYNLFIWTNQLVNARINGVGGSAMISTTAIENDTWYHLAFTFDGQGDTGQKVNLYINGVLEDSGDHPDSSVGTGGAPIWIGELDANRGFPWDGIMDEIAIWNVALSQDQINKLMVQPDKTEILNFPSGPSPADGAVLEATWVNLDWTGGELAVSHDVYLGESFDQVNEATVDSPVYLGNFTDTFTVIGFAGFAFPEGLVPGTTYYWRVDAINEAESGSPWKGDVWSFSIPPKTAYDPSVPDGAMFVDPNVELSWTPGFGAILHTVYFGDDLETVTNAAGGAPASATTFTPGPLELEKTYYWRVDEFIPPTTIKGDLWSFTTTLPGLGKAIAARWENVETTNINSLKTNPNYPDNPDVTEEVTEFLWNGEDLDNYGGQIEAWLYVPSTGDFTFWLNTDDQGELWLSTDDDPGNMQLIARESSYSSFGTWGGGEEKSDPIPLVGGQKYYIMAIWKEGGGGDHCQVAWQGPGVPERTVISGGFLSPFEPLKAYGAKPSDSATGVTQVPILTWQAGLQAASHEVYFGTDEQAVADATKASAQYKSSRQLGDESYDPGKLEWSTDYYWRVDEVNNTNPDSPWLGAVWHFTTADFLIVDDFESYDNIDPPAGEPGANRIFDKWIDGFGTTTNGAQVGNLLPPYAEQVIVHSGSQSMNYSYDNAGKTSEATLTLQYPRDWTEQGVTKLSLWFRGDAANAADRVFIALNGNAVVYHDDASATQTADWTEWVIDLQKFADQGVNLTNVNTITIGVGTKNAPSPGGGTGTVYFDDIRLYR